MLKNLKLRAKILFMLLLISFITASIVGIVAFTIGTSSLKEDSYKKLTAIREMKANQIENYFQLIFDQVISFSEDRMVIEAALNFKKGFDNVEKELDYSQESMKKMDSVLYSYYQTEFLEQLFYRDSTINYFSIPQDELVKNQNLWLELNGDEFNVIDTESGFPKINPSEFSGNLNMSGSSTVSSLVKHITKMFKEEGAQGDIIYQSTSTSEGLKSLLNGSDVDIVGFSHRLRTEESNLFEEANIRPLSFRIGTDALVIVVGKGNTFLSNLSSAELKAVFTSAERWSDINPDWPNELINRFIPSEGSGSYNLFSEVILDGDKNALKNIPNTTFIKDGKNMKEKMDTDPFSVAFFAYNYYDKESLLKILDIDGVELDNASINNKTYHLTRPLYLITTETKLKANKNIAFLLNYFLNTVGLEVGTSLNEIEYWPQQSNHRILQYQYIANNPYLKGEKDNLVELPERSSYNSFHQLYHPIFKNYLDRFGYYDIFIIDADSGNIVYSVSKEVDFATDIIDGPYSETNLSNIFKKVNKSNSPNYFSFEDFSPYLPSYNAPASFIASPIFDGDKKIGVLVFQLPINKINKIMTDGYDWENVGLGKTGESYLVGSDYLIRNQSRFLIEEPENYFKALEQAHISRDITSKIKILNSAIGLQPVITEGTKAALNGETNTQIFKDYRGVDVLSAYKPLSIDQVNWVIMSEIDKTEAFAAIPAMIKSFMYWLVLLLVIVLVISVLFARTISRPLQILNERATELAQGNLDDPILIEQRDEIGLLAGNFEKMRGSLKKLVMDLKYINQNLEVEVANRTEELSAANQQIQGIVDSLADALIIINEQGIIESFSPSAEKMFQFKANEIIGLNISKLMPSPHKENHDSYLDNYKNTGKAKIIGYEREVNAIRKDGSVFPARLMVSEVSTENKRLFVGLMSDLTARKKAELKLKSQSAALKSTDNSVVITNTEGIIVWVNPAFTKLTGYTWREAVGKNPSVLNSGKHDDKYFEDLWSTISKGDTWHGDVINKKKNGDLYYEEMTITPILDDKDKIIQFVAIKQDVTERKKLEIALEKANKRMSGELNVAKDIQMSMLPLIFPAFPKRDEVNIYAELIPAREVGGDFYDFHFIDENHLCFVMADVSGKGVPAALMMAVTKTLIKSRASNDKSPASILTDVNNEIAKDNDSYMFITVFLAILNTNTGELIYSNAGHNPSYVICKEKKELTKLGDLHGPVIGAMEGMTYGETKLLLKKNDIVFSYTDGVTESHNINAELYSDPRLEKLLENGDYDSPETLTKLVIESVKEFEGEAEQFDDITAMAIEYCQNPNTISSIISSIKIKNDLKQIATAIEWFEAFALENKMPFAIIQKINIAFDELLNNIISYGYDDEDVHEIDVEIELRSERLIIIIRDDGIPFNPFKKDPPDTMLTVEERMIGGLGIHLVKKLMDEYEYKRHTNKNIITLIKHNINK